MTLLQSLLVGELPHKCRSRLPRKVGSYPTDLEIEDGYPSEGAIEAVRCVGFSQARQWLREEFPALAEQLPCAYVEVDEDEEGMKIDFSTGGWSGCEDLIGAVEANLALSYYIRSWQRGGHYVIHVRPA